MKNKIKYTINDNKQNWPSIKKSWSLIVCTIQLIKVPINVLSQLNTGKILGTSIIYSIMSPPVLLFTVLAAAALTWRSSNFKELRSWEKIA